MKMESLRTRTEPLTKILFAVAVLLGALVFLKIGFFVSSSNAMMTAAQADPNQVGATDWKKLLAETKASADQIKKNNLFVPVSAKQHPVNEVIGILGREALIGDKWYKVGDRVGEAKIVAIEPTKVKVVWEGQEKEFSPIGSSGAGGRGDGSGSSGRMSGAGAGSRRGPGQQAAGTSAEDRDTMRERLKNATSPEERQRLREEMMRQKAGGTSR
jgi:hypothetical protein